MQVEGQVLVLEEGVVVEAAALDLLEEGADVPAVQHLQQHYAGHTQPHIQHRFQAALPRHRPPKVLPHNSGLSNTGEKGGREKERERKSISLLQLCRGVKNGHL